MQNSLPWSHFRQAKSLVLYGNDFFKMCGKVLLLCDIEVKVDTDIFIWASLTVKSHTCPFFSSSSCSCQLGVRYKIRRFCVALETLHIQPQFTLWPHFSLYLLIYPLCQWGWINVLPTHDLPMSLLLCSPSFTLQGMTYPVLEVQILYLLSPIPPSLWSFPVTPFSALNSGGSSTPYSELP